MSFLKAALAAAVSLPIIVGVAMANPGEAGDAVALDAVATDEAAAVENPAAPPESGAVEAAEKAPAAEERKICKTVVPIGTRFGKKYCKTKEEWDDMRRQSQDDLSDVQRRGSEYRTPN